MHTKRIVRLWERMTALYGSRWSCEYGPDLDAAGKLAPLAAIWADALEDADNSAIASGIRKCLDRDRDTPPTLPEFLRLCGARTGQPPRDTRPDLPRLPAPSETPQRRCENLANGLAAQADSDLAGQLMGAEPKERAAIIRAYWMTRIGACMVGKSLARQWGAAS